MSWGGSSLIQMISKNALSPRSLDKLGAQVSKPQFDKILNYINIGKEEGAEVLVGGEAQVHEGETAGGFYIQPT